jgi:hypothetical protein
MGTGLPQEVELSIIFNQETGEIRVGGPIANKLFCYGLLESAKEIVSKFNPNAPQNKPLLIPRLVPPRMPGPNNVPGKG